jgi:hypothetical protein
VQGERIKGDKKIKRDKGVKRDKRCRVENMRNPCAKKTLSLHHKQNKYINREF